MTIVKAYGVAKEICAKYPRFKLADEYSWGTSMYLESKDKKENIIIGYGTNNVFYHYLGKKDDEEWYYSLKELFSCLSSKNQ